MIGAVSVLVVIIPQIRHSSIAKTLLEQIPVARRSAQAPPAEGRVSSAPSKNAFSGLNPQFGAGYPVAPENNSELLEAAKFIVPAPPQTELALQGVDPSLLRATFQRGLIAMKSGMDAEKGNGAHLISVAGVLGYQPARFLIAQEYPSSAALRSVVSSLEAVRYSLDPLLISGKQSDARRPYLVLLASYFSGRQALLAYATDLLTALRDDPRLQTNEHVESLLGLLTRVRGACTAVASVIVKARIATRSECFSGLNLQIDNYLHINKSPGLEAESRRQALRWLEANR